MSFMTTSMFAPRIWGYDLGSPQARLARAAGWGRADLIWEHLMERACAAWAAGETGCAARLIRRATWLARLAFGAQDPRRATGLVNRAICDLAAGRRARAEAGLARAAALWDRAAAPAIADMQIAPRARSSLFHLRMETHHRATYHDNMRHRFRKIAAETDETIAALRAGATPAHRHFSRWKGEKPSLHDDTRKVLSACLLIFDA